MFREIARPLALVLCVLSLLAVFQAAFFEPASDIPHRIREALALLGLYGTVSLLSGWIFCDNHTPHTRQSRLIATLPIQLFAWATAVMVVLFILAWYLETYSIFEGHVHY